MNKYDSIGELWIHCDIHDCWYPEYEACPICSPTPLIIKVGIPLIYLLMTIFIIASMAS